MHFILCLILERAKTAKVAFIGMHYEEIIVSKCCVTVISHSQRHELHYNPYDTSIGNLSGGNRQWQSGLYPLRPLKYGFIFSHSSTGRIKAFENMYMHECECVSACVCLHIETPPVGRSLKCFLVDFCSDKYLWSWRLSSTLIVTDPLKVFFISPPQFLA